MADTLMQTMSIEFSVQIINLVKELRAKHETIISNQIGRSGTSIGANIHEARYAQSTKDFISKMEIALKESGETLYWLIILKRTGYIDSETYNALNSTRTNLRNMLVASCKTTKSNNKL